MKITAVEPIVLRVPDGRHQPRRRHPGRLPRPHPHRRGNRRDRRGGHVSLSRADDRSRCPRRTRSREACASCSSARTRSQIDRLWQRHVRRRPTTTAAAASPLHVISAIDMALWDIAGKAAGRPVYDLLGGARVQSVSGVRERGDARDGRRGAQRSPSASVAAGYGALKLGWGPLGRTSTTTSSSSRAARDALGPERDADGRRRSWPTRSSSAIELLRRVEDARHLLARGAARGRRLRRLPAALGRRVRPDRRRRGGLRPRALPGARRATATSTSSSPISRAAAASPSPARSPHLARERNVEVVPTASPPVCSSRRRSTSRRARPADLVGVLGRELAPRQ